MKVLQVNNFHHVRGGADKVYLETCRLLEEQGHEVIHFSSNHKDNLPSKYDSYFVDGVDYFTDQSFSSKTKAGRRYIFNREAKQKFEKLLVDTKPDIAHLHIFQSRLSSSILPLFKAHKIPVLMHIHEYKMLCPVYTFINGKGEVCEQCASGNTIPCITNKCNKGSRAFSAVSAIEARYTNRFLNWEKYIDRFVFVSEFIRDKHIRYRPGVKSKAELMYNPFFGELPALPTRSDDYYIYFGRFSHEKGIQTLLQAWQEIGNLKLKVVGRGPIEDDIKAQAANNPNVEFIGFKQGEELRNLVMKARFSLMPSEWYENNPLSVIESMGLGTPVIGANIGGIPELLQHGGMVHESFDKQSLIKKIKEANELTSLEYEKIRTDARSYVEQELMPNQYINSLLELYQSML